MKLTFPQIFKIMANCNVVYPFYLDRYKVRNEFPWYKGSFLIHNREQFISTYEQGISNGFTFRINNQSV